MSQERKPAAKIPASPVQNIDLGPLVEGKPAFARFLLGFETVTPEAKVSILNNCPEAGK